MSSVAIVQRKLALPVVGSCQECHWLKPCGGYRDHNGLFGNTCFERHCCGGKPECNYLCDMHPRFTTMLNEVEGLRFDRLPPLTQRRVAVPAYVLSLLHHSGRTRPLEIPFAAVPPKEVLRVRQGHMQVVATDAAGLRQRLWLGPKTRVVLNCVQPDEELEKLWEFWLQDDVPAQLARLGIDLVIGPNFSHFNRVPRTEILGNRMRHLMCLRGLRAAGLNAVPHLSVVDPQDWDFWREWLAANPKVRYVAFEFETGYKNPVDGADAIDRLACVQAAVGRELHPVVIGGTQYLAHIRRRFRTSTFIDGSPFWNTTHRQRARFAAGQLAWSPSHTEPGEPLDDLFAHNFAVYTERMRP